MTDLGLFVAARSTEVVNGRIAAGADPRLATVMAAAVQHLHAFVNEVRPTADEWMAAIRFLTATGHACDDWRQEFILLSDVLGVSMLVDAINHDRPEGATPNTILGPFYVRGAPPYPHGGNICLDGKGEPTLVFGRVIDTNGRPIEGATIDVWQTNDEGFYDVQQPDVQPSFNLRGLFTSGTDGEYAIRTVKPRFYPIPDDGPVGKLLRALGRHPNRAAHMHFIVDAAGYDRLVTHIFPDDCHYLKEDTVFGVKPELVAHFEDISGDDNGAAPSGGIRYRLEWNFILNPAPAPTGDRRQQPNESKVIING